MFKALTRLWNAFDLLAAATERVAADMDEIHARSRLLLDEPPPAAAPAEVPRLPEPTMEPVRNGRRPKAMP